MTEKKLDRRIRRTRRMLKQALLDLSIEKDFDALTITEIAERAEIQRATFYLHYATKEDLLMAILDDTFNALVVASERLSGNDFMGGKTQPDAYKVTFDHVAENADLYRVLFRQSGGAMVRERIRSYLVVLILSNLQQIDEPEQGIPYEMMAHYIAGAEITLIDWWLMAGMPYTTSKMAKMAHQLVLKGVYSVMDEAGTLQKNVGDL